MGPGAILSTSLSAPLLLLLLPLLHSLFFLLSVSPASAGVNITTLPHSLVVSVQVNGADIATSSELVHDQDTLQVFWHLNDSYLGQDDAFQTVLVQFCYGAASTKGRPWRAPNQDLSKAKDCPITIAKQNYSRNSTTLLEGATGMGSAMWQASMETPGGQYFVRVFALNSADPTATPASSAVAVGQTTNANATSNLVTVEPYMGTTTTLNITIIVLSVSSYLLLFGIFCAERWMKKNK